MKPERWRRIQELLERAAALDPGARQAFIEAEAKLLRRNRGGVVAAAAILILAVAFSVYSGNQARRLARERDRVQVEARTSQQTAAFLENLLTSPDPFEGKGDSMLVRDVLEEAVRRIPEDLNGQPAVQARLLRAIGRVDLSNARYAEADSLLHQALDLQRSTPGTTGHDLAATLNSLGELEAGQGRYATALPYFKQAQDLLETEAGPDSTTLASVLSNIGLYTWRNGDPAGAAPIFRRVVAIYAEANGPDDAQTMFSIVNLSSVLWESGQRDASRKVLEPCLPRATAALGPDHPATLGICNNLAAFREAAFDMDGALELREKVYDGRRRIHGPHHPESARALFNLAYTANNAGKLGLADSLAQEAIAEFRTDLGPDHPQLVFPMWLSGIVEIGLGRFDAGEQRLEETREFAIDHLGPGHPLVAQIEATMALCGWVMGDLDRAAAMEQAARPELEASLPADAPDRFNLEILRAVLLRHRGNRSEADSIVASLTAPDSLRNYGDLGPLLNKAAYLAEDSRWPEVRALLQIAAARGARDASLRTDPRFAALWKREEMQPLLAAIAPGE